MQDRINSFIPIIGENPKTLVLGTLPSIKSLEIYQYYGNPRNTFWKILFTLFKQEYSSNYNDKKALALNNNIAIWDVCYSAIRQGSLDSAIHNEKPNKINNLIELNPTIELIAFNGQGATKLYQRYFPVFDDIEYLTLLSTSPANARYNFDDKLRNWKQIL